MQRLSGWPWGAEIFHAYVSPPPSPRPLAQIDHNSLTLDSSPICVRAAVEAAVEGVAPDASKAGLELAYSLDPALAECPILGDSIRVRQVGGPLYSL